MLESFFNYLQFEKRYSTHTLTAYSIDLSQFEEYTSTTYETQKLETIEYPIIRSWIISLAEQKLSAKSIHRKVSSVRAYYKYLMRHKLIDKDPTVKIRTPKIPKRLPIYAKEAEMNTVLDAVPNMQEDTFEGVRDKLVIELLYGTGMRLTELIGLEDKDIDLHNQVVKVMGKGNKQRLIPLHNQLVAAIVKYRTIKSQAFPDNNNVAFVVTNKSLKAYPIFINRIVKKNLNLIPTLEKKSPHVLRHSFATNLLNKGADLNAIKELLGHSSLAATQVYTHNSLGKLKQIFDQAHPKAEQKS